MKENKKNIMRFEMNPAKPLKLTKAAKARLKQLEKAAIDYSDIPELTDEWFSKAAFSIAVPSKKPVSLRIDEDILTFFKSLGTRYQTRINAILRAYVDTQKKKFTR